MTGTPCIMKLQVTPDFMEALQSIAKTFSFSSTEQALTNAAEVLYLASRGAQMGGELHILFPDGTSKQLLTPNTSKKKFKPVVIPGGKQ